MRNTNIDKVELYKEKFATLDLKELGLMNGERVMHCIDDTVFNGKLFVPEWAVSNYGRVYSLWGNRWLTPQATGTRRYWHVVGSKQPGVHELVVYYFRDESDMIALEEFGESGVEVQHLIPIVIPDELKHGTIENRTARIKHCMKVNCKSNVCYQKKSHNRSKDKLITKGYETEEERNGVEVWSEEMKTMRSMMAGSGSLQGNSNGARIEYSRTEDGKIKESINMLLKLKGSLLEKDEVLIDSYKINGGEENKRFIEENVERIKEIVKQYPPKHKDYRKGRIIDGRCIYYALK